VELTGGALFDEEKGVKLLRIVLQHFSFRLRSAQFVQHSGQFGSSALESPHSPYSDWPRNALSVMRIRL